MANLSNLYNLNSYGVRSRSKWKGAYSKSTFALYKRILDIHNHKASKSIFKYRSGNQVSLFVRRTHERSSIILPQHIKLGTIGVYSGRYMIPIKVTNDHVGFRLGEFTLTARSGSKIHRNNSKTKKNKSKK